MARGIVKIKPDGSGNMGNGKIIVTEFPADPVNGTPGMDVGTEISFIDANQSKVGDLVDFNLDSTGNGKINSVVASGTVIPNNFPDNITVASGQSVIINGTTVFDGKITNNGGVLTIVDSAHVEGKIVSSNPSSFLLIDGGDLKTVSHGGTISISGPGSISVKNATINGTLSSNGNSFVAVQKCTFYGKLEVLNCKVSPCSKIFGNDVKGDTNIPQCP